MGWARDKKKQRNKKLKSVQGRTFLVPFSPSEGYMPRQPKNSRFIQRSYDWHNSSCLRGPPTSRLARRSISKRGRPAPKEYESRLHVPGLAGSRRHHSAAVVVFAAVVLVAVPVVAASALVV